MHGKQCDMFALSSKQKDLSSRVLVSANRPENLLEPRLAQCWYGPPALAGKCLQHWPLHDYSQNGGGTTAAEPLASPRHTAATRLVPLCDPQIDNGNPCAWMLPSLACTQQHVTQQNKLQQN
jgi:hypothetical protein